MGCNLTSNEALDGPGSSVNSGKSQSGCAIFRIFDLQFDLGGWGVFADRVLVASSLRSVYLKEVLSQGVPCLLPYS